MVTKTNEQLQVRVSGADGQAIVVLLNIADDGYEFADAGPGEQLVASGEAAAGQDGPVVTVGGHGWAIIKTG